MDGLMRCGAFSQPPGPFSLSPSALFSPSLKIGDGPFCFSHSQRLAAPRMSIWILLQRRACTEPSLHTLQSQLQLHLESD